MTETEKKIKIVILGDKNTGKSSMQRVQSGLPYLERIFCLT